MTRIIFCILVSMLQACSLASATPQERWVLIGDSIQSQVFGPGSQAKELTANRIPQLKNVHIQNISSPGATMSSWLGYVNHKNMLNQIDGFFGAKGVIIAVGTNDWGGTPTGPFGADYMAYVQHARSLGLEVVCVSPIWRADKDTYKTNPDGASYQLWVYSWVIENACIQGGGKFVNGFDAPLVYPTNFADDVHLNGSGHAVFTNWLIQRMNQLGYWTSTY